MLLQIASDLHCEFGTPKKFRVEPNIDALILAGDIHTSPEGLLKFIAKLRRSIGEELPILIVPGNHEYYRHDFEDVRCAYGEALEPARNTYWMDNAIVVLQGFRFIGTTLYTDLSNPVHAADAQRIVTDFKVVKGMTPEHWTKTYQHNRWFLDDALSCGRPNQVVITHMLPSFSLVQDQFKGEPASPAFAVEVTDLMEKYNPLLWVYGHDHRARMDTKIFNTRVVCNQVGYYFEKLDYRAMLIEV
jgi:Icc-related predicted phosphoesterase